MSINNKHVNEISPTPDKAESVCSSSTEELEVFLGPLGSGGENNIRFQAQDLERYQMERARLTTALARISEQLAALGNSLDNTDGEGENKGDCYNSYGCRFATPVALALWHSTTVTQLLLSGVTHQWLPFPLCSYEL